MTDHDYSGTTLDDQYKVISLIGKGSMGAVYLGQNLNTGTQVAVKLLHASLLENEDSIKRFFREARAAVEISHENIINVIDVGLSTFDEPYIVMEYLQGETLAAMLKRVGRVDLKTALSIIEPVLMALNAIHEKGIVHRDIKPEKIFLVRRQRGAPLVKLIDFGLSKFTESSAATMLTVAGTVIGDVAYISPEQARGDKNVDRRTDIYAVGMILYRVLAGRLPFDSTRYHEVLIAKMSGKLKHPQEAYSGFPEEAIAFVLDALSRDPIERPQNALVMLNTLRSLVSSSGPAGAQNKLSTGSPAKAVTGNFTDGKKTDEIKRPEPTGSGSPLANMVVKFQNAWRSRSKPLFIGLGTAASVVLILIVAAFAGSSGVDSDHRDPGRQANRYTETGNENTAETPAPVEAPVEQPTDVQIELRGLPSDAKIFYDGARVPVNPFRVALKEVIIPLKVEAEGFEPYLTHLVPSENQVVRVDMKSLSDEEQGVSPDIAKHAVGGGETEESTIRPAPIETPRNTGQTQPKKPKKRPRRSPKKKSSKFMHEFD